MDYKYFYRAGIIIGFSSRFDRNLFIYGSENRILWRYYSEPTIYIEEKVLLDILIVGENQEKIRNCFKYIKNECSRVRTRYLEKLFNSIENIVL